MYVGYDICLWCVLVIILSNTEVEGINVDVWLGICGDIQKSQEPVGGFETNLQIDITFGYKQLIMRW